MVDINENELSESIELMYFAYRRFTEEPDRILKKRGLNRVHHRILYFVGRYPAASVNRLLETLQTSKQAVNLPLRQLIEMNLIVSRKSLLDKRVKELTLTVQGRSLERRLTATQTRLFQQVFAESGKRQFREWKQTMTRMGMHETL